jgi:hypothetical protein
MPGTLETRVPSADRRTPWWVYSLGALLIVAAVVLAVTAGSGPKKLGAVTVRNNTPFEVSIVTSAVLSGDVTPLGIVPAGATETFREVIDQGPTWYFHLTSEGVDGGTVERSRADIARRGWALVVDGEAEARFRAAGLVPDRHGGR